MVPKSQEASNIRHGEQTRDASQQANITQQIAQHANENTQRTVRMSEADNPEYRYDAKEKGNGEYSSNGERKKKRENREEQQEGRTSVRPGGFDIRI